ncbi:ABC transporter permease [Mucilaginibacter psychrotolerans]|uniref:ABC transporter permease n=1 Tax=Mucilaginibacter psychrotolerans TaxID=1524096 RepID=A0A4Y8SD27_9SPHI|nr:ABC transporter permease [Mucilaginibacter psychrotolerans]TFF36507.1 ABC transporter permease [Mucilaginibacter psychrotolerans]
MNTSIYIAKRYLFSKKQTHAINIISGISMLGVLVASGALIVILSVFNGFEKVILSLYSDFTPEINIEPREGKTFDPNTAQLKQLKEDGRVFSYTLVLQDKVLIRYADKPFIATLKGVTDDFLKKKELDSIVKPGPFIIKDERYYFAVIGSTVQSSLGISLRDQFTPMQIYSPRRAAGSANNPLSDFVYRPITPSGVFSVQQDFNDMVITPIAFARDLLEEPVNVSSIEINLKPGTNIDDAQADIQEKLGNGYVVKNRKEQNTGLYKTINYERWSIFMILVFVLIIAIFNIIGSLTMLVIDKRKDIAILTSLGAGKPLIRGIFFFEGMMISMIGCVGGIILGSIICLVQLQFSLIKMGTKMSVLDAYPVAFKASDYLLVFVTVFVIAVIASGISASLSVKRLDEIKQDL